MNNRVGCVGIISVMEGECWCLKIESCGDGDGEDACALVS